MILPLISILAWLLHHANRNGRDDHFYKIKNKLLAKYGNITGFDVQFIEGKKCYTCGGTGIYEYYNDDGEVRGCDYCWHCYEGWYKRPTWNILYRIQFGKYTFHQPLKRVYKKPELINNVIDGYISHSPSKYTNFALTVLFIIFERGYIFRYLKESGRGWRVRWYRPDAWLNNTIHIIKHGFGAMPFVNLRLKIEKLFDKNQPVVCQNYEYDDLPF